MNNTNRLMSFITMDATERYRQLLNQDPDNSKAATQQNGCFIPQYFAGNLEPTEIKSVTTKHYSGLILDLGFLILDFYI